MPELGQGQVLIKTEAMGLNYADTLRRKNLYFQATPLPYVLGSEAVRSIVKMGEGLAESGLNVGSKLVVILPFGGGYAEYVVNDAMFTIPIPETLDSAQAMAIFVQGTTAFGIIEHYSGELNGKTVLINGAAGGVGSILVQLARKKGAKTIIAACGNPDKFAFLKELGADFAVNYRNDDWINNVLNANNGNKVDVVLEMVRGKVFNESLNLVRSMGTLVTFGAASLEKGSIQNEYLVDEAITVKGFNLAHFINGAMLLWQQALGAVIEMVLKDELKLQIGQTFPLTEAASAHIALESRKTTGKIVLIP